jgi:primosomal protein N' (replication factor Y)
LKRLILLAIIKALIEKEIFEDYFIQEDRVTNGNWKINCNSTAQQIAFEGLKQVLFKRCFIAWRYFERKTEIYIKLIQEYLQTGKQILYLLIALTTS